MSGTPSLDSFGEIYRGFSEERKIIKAALPDAEAVWKKAFEGMGRTPDLYQCSDESVARETMRFLLSVVRADGG
ncbi:MAG TPA: hypothetical protein VNM38_06965 [Solirubrobacterales bacterium]|nr:hypothetical protein [Solirubrobacterales bacterium]